MRFRIEKTACANPARILAVVLSVATITGCTSRETISKPPAVVLHTTSASVVFPSSLMRDLALAGGATSSEMPPDGSWFSRNDFHQGHTADGATWLVFSASTTVMRDHQHSVGGFPLNHFHYETRSVDTRRVR